MRVYVVWVPMLEMDEAAAVSEAVKYLPDQRATHYWDGKGVLKDAYSKVLQIGQPAWDVYLAYGKEAEWQATPPAPSYWMHQLSLLGQESRLDGDTFAAEVNKLLSQDAK